MKEKIIKRTLSTGILLLSLCLGMAAQAQSQGTAPFYLKFSPMVDFPLLDSATLFGFGGGMTVAGGFALPFFTPLSVRVDLDYGFGTTTGTPTVSLLSASAGLDFGINFTSFLGMDVYAGGGYTYAFINPSATVPFEGYSNPFVKGGAMVRFFLTPEISIDAGGSFIYQVGLYTGIGASAGMTIGFGGTPAGAAVEQPTPTPTPAPAPLEAEPAQTAAPKAGEQLTIESVKLNPVFPVFYKYYYDHSVGSIRVTNGTSGDVKSVKVSFWIKAYMSAAQQMAPIALLAKGESKDVNLFALFSDEILKVTEKTKVQAEITVSYAAGGQTLSVNKVESIDVVDRNAMTWDDDRKAAAFVTPKDTPVLQFAKNVAGAIKNQGSKAVNANLTMAMAIHEALNAYKLAYIVDPKSSYTDFSASKTAVDYLQFPRQTLSFKGGDCDDLTILNCALLEAVGIETAIITIPGHIFMAFSLNLTPDQARNLFTSVSNLIFINNEQTWVPVEITQIDGGFLKAWEMGAKEYTENKMREQANFYTIAASQKIYEPAFFKGEDIQVTVPSSEAFVAAFLQEQIKFIDTQIARTAASLQAEISKSQDNKASTNKLGVLYAKYGLLDRAEKQFSQILAKTDYAPALVNMGNIRYSQGKLEDAAQYYEKAYKASPNTAAILLGLARVNFDQENYGAAHKYYQLLDAQDSALAMKYAYLDMKGDEAARAAEASGAKEAMEWTE